jgi:hypothetical protein
MWRRRGGSRLALCGGGFAQEQQPFDVVDQIGQADFRRRPRDPDGSDEQAHAGLLLSEDVLDLAADFRFRVVGAPRT